MTRERLTTPAIRGVEFCIDESIWGHRIYNEQTPWMTLLEMLGVLQGTDASRRFRESEGFAPVTYEVGHRMALRNILFNNAYLEEARRKGGDDDERWRLWIEKMNAHAAGVRDAGGFGYLRRAFPSTTGQSDSFGDFENVVNLLRATSIEGDSNKRWTSKFVFPYGPASLFPDLRLDVNGDLSMDRRFFGRTGEIVYLMLCRSGRGAELSAEFERTVLNARAPWNRLVERLQPSKSPGVGVKVDAGHLPYAKLPDYEALADDLLGLLKTRLPGYDVLPHLVDLIGLHLVLYVLKRAAEWAPEDGEVRMVLEIIAPKRTTVRDLAVESFQTNARRSGKAVDAFITREVEQTEAWLRARAIADDGERLDAMRAVLWKAVRMKEANPESDEATFNDASPERALGDLRERAQKRHEAHLGDAHTSYAQAIGLASRRGTRRVRYAPNDQLLKTLVLAVVPQRMEFQRFLEELWRRYHMVIGHHQAGDLVKSGGGDQVAFEENARRLEMRLASLGLLRRLSDACAYVENPMSVESLAGGEQ